MRYRIVPYAGEQHLDTETLESKPANYLFDEISGRLQSGPIEFRLLAQIAEDSDVTNNATVIWPEDRNIVELGTLKIEKTLSEEESLVQQKKVIFDPIPRVEGVEPSDDPLLEVRANVYLISGQQRRATQGSEPTKVESIGTVEATT